MTLLSVLALALGLFSCQKEDEKPAEPVKGSVRVASVKVEGVYATLDPETSTFLATLPAVTDFSSLSVVFSKFYGIPGYSDLFHHFLKPDYPVVSFF